MCIYFHFPIGVLHLLRVVVSWSLIVPERQIYLVFIAAILNFAWAFEYRVNLKKKNSDVWTLPKTYWKQIFRGEA